MTTVEVLKAARAKLAEPGVWVNELPDETHHCALSAIIDSGGSGGDQFLRTAIGVRSIASWNDAPERTLKDVLEAFDRAIELAGKSEVKP